MSDEDEEVSCLNPITLERLAVINQMSQYNKPCDEVSVAAQLIKRVKECKGLCL